MVIPVLLIVKILFRQDEIKIISVLYGFITHDSSVYLYSILDK
jgi:hypothetical protein